MGRVSGALRVTLDVAELVFAEQDGAPHLVISSKRIAQNKAKAARQIAQLIAAARQSAGLEEWTSVGTIRQVVSDYGRLDSSNFAASLQQMDDVAVLRGKGLQREIKITRPGIEATAELVRSLAGVEG